MTYEQAVKRREEIIMLRNNRYTYQVIADRLGISKQRVWQIEHRELHPDTYYSEPKVEKPVRIKTA